MLIFGLNRCCIGNYGVNGGKFIREIGSGYHVVMDEPLMISSMTHAGGLLTRNCSRLACWSANEIGGTSDVTSAGSDVTTVGSDVANVGSDVTTVDDVTCTEMRFFHTFLTISLVLMK